MQGSKREYLAPDWCGNENDSRIDDEDDRIDNDVDRHDAVVENRDYSWCDVIDVMMSVSKNRRDCCDDDDKKLLLHYLSIVCSE